MYDSRGKLINGRQVLRYGDTIIVKNVHTNGVLSRGALTPNFETNTDKYEAMSHHTGKAVHLTVVSATDDNITLAEGPVHTHEHVHLKTLDGYYFQRDSLKHYDTVWRGGRFSLAFIANSSSQTCLLTQEASISDDWKSSRSGSSGNKILYSADVGVTFAGMHEDDHHPDTSVRRFLTLRPSDPPTCVVTAWGSHEHLRLQCIKAGQKEVNWQRRKAFLIFLKENQANLPSVRPFSVRTVLYLEEMVRSICSFL